jgi:glycosyltransferase involved in cell wall biosynthesis
LVRYKAAFTRVLEDAVERFNPDIIHSNHLFLLSALVRKLFPNLPVVVTCHGTDLRQYHNCPQLRPFVKQYCQRLDRIIALTADQKTDIARVYDIPSDRIAVVGGGYDEKIFNRVPKQPAGTVQILYAGKLNLSKGVPWLLRSLMKIREHDWHLHLAGSGKGPEYRQCIDLAEQLGPKVTNHGYVSHQRLAELMKTAHIQVLPSFFEGLPLVLFEGLASGCRIITTQLPGFREIFGKASRETIRLIELPPLETIDQPYEKDQAQLDKVLRACIVDMIAVVKRLPDFDDPQAEEAASSYTWSRVFKRTVSVYSDALLDKRRSR